MQNDDRPLRPLTLREFRSRPIQTLLREAQALWDARCAETLSTLTENSPPRDDRWGPPEIRVRVSCRKGCEPEALPGLRQSATENRMVWAPALDEVLAFLYERRIPALYEPTLID